MNSNNQFTRNIIRKAFQNKFNNKILKLLRLHIIPLNFENSEKETYYSLPNNKKTNYIYKLLLVKSITEYVNNSKYRINSSNPNEFNMFNIQTIDALYSYVNGLNLSDIEKIHSILYNKRHNHSHNLESVKNPKQFIDYLLNSNLKNKNNLQAVDIFIADLRLHGLDYYANMFDRLNRLTSNLQNRYEIGNLFEDPIQLKNEINRQIGLCHMLDTQRNLNKQRIIAYTYLPRLRNQLKYIASKYKQYKLTPNQNTNLRIRTFMNRYKTKLGGRPCLENALDAAIDMFVEFNFTWKGKNLNQPLMFPINNNTKQRYIRNVLIPALQSFQNSVAKNDEYKKLNLKQRKNYFWNYIKKRPLTVFKNNAIKYINVDQFDVNAKIYKNDFNEYSNLLEIDAE